MGAQLGEGPSLTDGDGGTGDLDQDEIFDLMSNHRRRYAIQYCKQVDGPTTLSDLAEQVAAWEQEKEIQELTSAERKTVYTSLQQTHLPRLDRAGVVEFDNGEVELTDKIDTIDIYLDIVPENSVPWGVYYLCLSVISAVTLVGVWTNFLPTETIPVLGYAVGIVTLFLVSAAYHTLVNHRYRLEEFEEPP